MEYSNGKVYCLNILDGKSYEGSFKSSKPDGKGKLVLENGSTRFGEWSEGKLVKWYDNQ